MKTPKQFRTKIYLLIFLCVLNSFNLLKAQKPNPKGIAPFMKINNLNHGELNPMRIDILKIDIKVIGQMAITTMDMTYYNDNNRAMEGEFNFPLGEGQTVSRFALDVNGTMREGVVVEKEQGRKTFEAVTRRGVDPGLLEMTEGNNFRSRVYPLPAKGTRRIVFAFEQELTDKGTYDLYFLPLNISELVKKFYLHAELIKSEARFDNPNNEMADIVMNRWNDSYVSDLEKSDYIPNKHIAISFPHVSDSITVYISSFKNHSDSSYFYVNLRPKLISREKTLPSKITILWDNSNSEKTRDIQKEIELMDAYIQKIKNLQVELINFNIKTSSPRLFQIVDGKWDDLKAVLNSTMYDGGTSFGCIDFTKYHGNEILLFSDGISNFGNKEPVYSKTPVYCINSNMQANHGFLSYITMHTGGEYINLTNMTIEDAFAILSQNKYHFISAKVEKGNAGNMYSSHFSNIRHSFSLSGIFCGNSAVVTLNFGFGNKVEYSQQIEILKKNMQESSLIKRFWAEKKLEELILNQDQNKEEIAQLGKKFGIITPNTSLIVLDNLSDYVKYKIVPPKEMQEDYFKQISAERKDNIEKLNNHIDYVVSLSNEQSKWWNTNYPLQKENTVQKIKNSTGQVAYRAPAEADSTSGNLSEVVVMGYGTQRRQDLMAAVSVVSSDEVSPAADISVIAAKQDNFSKGTIQINAWDPETPYLKVLQYETDGRPYQTYLKLKAEYGSSPSFYVDVADFFEKQGKLDTAELIVSNLAELKLESPQLLRVLGQKLLELNCTEDAILVYEKVLNLKGEEPQSYRDLGLAYESNGNPGKAISTLYEVVKREWDSRFPKIELVVMNEINSILEKYPKLNHSFIDNRLIKKEPVDVRVVLTWDGDNCDMDLWVTDPLGEKCFFSHKLTQLGGKISDDFTQGYGPEEFMLKNAMNGEYLVQSNYYGTRSQTLMVPVTLHLVFFANYGKSNQKRKEVSLRLENKQDIVDVGKFNFIPNDSKN